MAYAWAFPHGLPPAPAPEIGSAGGAPVFYTPESISTQSGAAVARVAHNHQVVGSNPTFATSSSEPTMSSDSSSSRSGGMAER